MLNYFKPGCKLEMLEMWESHSLNSVQNVMEVLTSFFYSCQPRYCDHENFGKSTIEFSQTFIKTLIILRLKYFWGKFCTSVLFNDVIFIAAIFLMVDWLWFKGATKLYFMYYFHVVIILFSKHLYKSVISTYDFSKTSFLSFCVLVLYVSVSLGCNF